MADGERGQSEHSDTHAPTAFAKVQLWLLILTATIMAWIVAGMAGDGILWHLSYDYVYPPNTCRDKAWQISVALGALVAAAAIVGKRPLPSAGWMARTGMHAMLSLTIISLGSAFSGWVAVKLGLVLPAADGLARLSRIAFCERLVQGASGGSWVVGIIVCVGVWRHRYFAKSIHSATVGCREAETSADVGRIAPLTRVG